MAWSARGGLERKGERLFCSVQRGLRKEPPPPEPRLIALRSLFFVLGEAEVPVEEKVLTLGVTDDALPIPTELGVVGGQQLQSSEHPGPEFLDQGSIAEV